LGDRKRPGRLPARLHGGRVLDRGTKALPLAHLQAARRGARGRPAARLVQGGAGSRCGSAVRLLLVAGDHQAFGDLGEPELDVLAAGLAERLGERRGVLDFHAEARVGLRGVRIPGDVDLGFADHAALVIDAQQVASGELGLHAARNQRTGEVGFLGPGNEHAVLLTDRKVAANEAEFAHRSHTRHITRPPYGALKTSVRRAGRSVTDVTPRASHCDCGTSTTRRTCPGSWEGSRYTARGSSTCP